MKFLAVALAMLFAPGALAVPHETLGGNLAAWTQACFPPHFRPPL